MTHHGQNLLLTAKQKFRFGLAWPCQAKAELLICSQQEVLANVMGHPVLSFLNNISVGNLNPKLQPFFEPKVKQLKFLN